MIKYFALSKSVPLAIREAFFSFSLMCQNLRNGSFGKTIFWTGTLWIAFLNFSAQSASSVWTGNTNQNWDGTNWSAGIPGANVGLISADTATFNSAGNGNTSVTIDFNRNIKDIVFANGSVSYTLGSLGSNAGNALFLTSHGSISITSSSTFSNLTETINAPIVLGGDYTFVNSRVNSNSALIFNGNISNAGTSVLTLDGASMSGAFVNTNVISGSISDGDGVQSVTTTNRSGNTWTLSGANSYSGLTTINNTGGTTIFSGSNSSSGETALLQGVLQLNSANNGGLASGIFTLAGGTLQASNASRTLSNEVSLAGTTLINGSQSLSLAGKTVGLAGVNGRLDVNISGGSLTLADVDINADLTASRTLTFGGNGTIAVTGVVANGNSLRANGLTIANRGNTTLSGTSTYSGLTTIEAGNAVFSGSNTSGGQILLTGGKLQLNSANNGGIAGGIITMAGGSIEAFNGSRSISNEVVLGGVATFSGNQSLTVLGKVTGLEGASRTLTLNHSNFITEGSLTLGDIAINTDIANARTLALTGAGILNVKGTISNGNAITANGLTLSNTRTTTLSGANTYSGTTTIGGVGYTVFEGSNTGGGETLLLSGYATLNSSSNGGLATGTLTLSGGKLEAVNAPRFLSNSVLLGQTVTIDAGPGLTFNGKTSGLAGASRSIFADGSLTLTDVDINTETANARTLNLQGRGTITISGTIANGNANTANGLIVENNGTTAFTGNSTYTGNTSFTSGVVILSGKSTGGGGTTISGGRIKLNSNFNGGLDTGTLVLNGGQLEALNASRSINSAVTLSSINVVGYEGLTINGKITGMVGGSATLKTESLNEHALTVSDIDINSETANARILTLSGGGILNVNGVISNGNSVTANGLTINRTGITTLSGANTYTGLTTITGGSNSDYVILSGSNSGNGGTVVSSGTVQLNSVSNGGLAGGALIFSGGDIQALNGDRTVSNAVSFSGGAFSGGQNLTLTGKTTGSAGSSRTLTSSLGTGKTLTLGNIDLNEDGAAARTLTIAGTGNTFINGVVASGSGQANSLVITNTGITTLASANTYTGATTVSAGTLLVNGTINATSGITVNGGVFNYANNSISLNRNVSVVGGNFKYNSTQAYGGSLSFITGRISGTGNLSTLSLTFGLGQTLAPGNSTGGITMGSAAFAGSGTFQFEINNAAGLAGSNTSGWDLLNAGVLNVTASSSSQFTLQIVSLNALQSSGMANNFNSAANYQWLFVDADSAITGFDAGKFLINSSGFQNSFNGTFSVAKGDSIIDGDSSQLFIVYTAVPEPGTWALLSLGLGLIVWTGSSKRKA